MTTKTKLVWLGVIVGVLVVSQFTNPSTPATPPPMRTAAAIAADSLRDVQRDARHMCREFVEGKLKAPATAKFGTVTAWAIKGKPGYWSATGYVDAQNSFGALLRTTFGCDMKHEAKNNEWTLIKLLM